MWKGAIYKRPNYNKMMLQRSILECIHGSIRKPSISSFALKNVCAFAQFQTSFRFIFHSCLHNIFLETALPLYYLTKIFVFSFKYILICVSNVQARFTV